MERLDTSRRHWEQQEATGSNRKQQEVAAVYYVYTPQPLTLALQSTSFCDPDATKKGMGRDQGSDASISFSIVVKLSWVAVVVWRG